MERKILILGVLVMSLAAAGVHAQTAPASTPQAVTGAVSAMTSATIMPFARAISIGNSG